MSLYILLILSFSLPFLPLSGSGQPTNFSQNSGGKGPVIGHSMVRVRRTKIWFPHLVRFGNQEVLHNVNRQIDKVTAELKCDGGGKGSYYKVQSRVDFAEKDIFSIYATAAYYCGGPYPTNDSNLSLTFDLRTGKQVAFEELFTDYKTNNREILQAIFAAQVARSDRLKQNGRPNGEDCKRDPNVYSLDNLEASEFAFNFSRNGLKVQPQWPHVIEACAEIVTVPYSRLRKFAAADGLLARMSK